jgi:hypothetical protein
MKQGDAVVLVKKAADGTVVRQNAIVIASVSYVPITADRKPIPGAVAEEHLDLAIPVISDVPLKTRNLDELFRLAYSVREISEDLSFGFEVGSNANFVEPVVEEPAPEPVAEVVVEPGSEADPGAVVEPAAAETGAAAPAAEPVVEEPAPVVEDAPAAE